MSGSVSGVGQGGNPYKQTSGSGLKEMLRASYNPASKTFEKMSLGESEKMEHLKNVEESVSRLSVPQTNLFPNTKQKISNKGKPIQTETKGVKEFFSDSDASRFHAVLSSVTRAQSKI
jgi:3-methyladenine DNA glycosylase AlkC